MQRVRVGRKGREDPLSCCRRRERCCWSALGDRVDRRRTGELRFPLLTPESLPHGSDEVGGLEHRVRFRFVVMEGENTIDGGKRMKGGKEGGVVQAVAATVLINALRVAA